jgi:proteic killer suppression protein
MDVRFSDPCLERLEADTQYLGEWPPGMVKSYRKRLNFIRQARDERDLYTWKSLRVERLKGNRQDQQSMRINDQWRLVFALEGTSPNKTLLVISIEDYH